MSTPSEPQPLRIDWSTATVKDAELNVELTPRPSKPWRSRFEQVLARLPHPGDGWGAIVLSKQTIRITDVREGSEDDVRHLLESVVLQVNTDLLPASDDEPAKPSATTQQASDQRSAEAFRAFAQDADAAESQAA